MFVNARAAFLLAAVGLFASLLGAQTYTRTQTSATYVQRTGTTASATRIGNLDDGAWAFALPFDFAFFNRTYRQAFLTSNGSVCFTASAVTDASVSTLAVPVAVINHPPPAPAVLVFSVTAMSATPAVIGEPDTSGTLTFGSVAVNWICGRPMAAGASTKFQ